MRVKKTELQKENIAFHENNEKLLEQLLQVEDEICPLQENLQKSRQEAETSGCQTDWNKFWRKTEELWVADFGRIKALVGSEWVNTVINWTKQQGRIEAEQKWVAKRKCNREAVDRRLFKVLLVAIKRIRVSYQE